MGTGRERLPMELNLGALWRSLVRRRAVAEQGTLAQRAHEDSTQCTSTELEMATSGASFQTTFETANSNAQAASETLLSALLAQLPVGVGLTDVHGRWVLKNETMNRFLGVSIPSHDPDVRPRWQAWDDQGCPIAPSRWPGAAGVYSCWRAPTRRGAGAAPPS